MYSEGARISAEPLPLEIVPEGEEKVVLAGPIRLKIGFPFLVLLLIGPGGDLKASLPGLVDLLGLLESGVVHLQDNVVAFLTLLLVTH